MNDTTNTTTPAASRPILTHCAICRLALTDSASVQIGIGPICRERCGYDAIPNHLRERANELIARVSQNLSDVSEVRFAADELRTMGLDRLAACLLDRFATLFLAALPNGDVASLTPFGSFREVANKLARWNRYGWNDKRIFRKGAGFWVIPARNANAFWAGLVAAFPGMIVKIAGQSVPVFLSGDAMPSLAADTTAPEKTEGDNAREIRALLTALDFGAKAIKFDAFGFSVAAAAAGYTVALVADNAVRAIREYSLDAARIFDVDNTLATPRAPKAPAAAVSVDRSAAAKRAWVTIRAKRAAALAATVAA